MSHAKTVTIAAVGTNNPSVLARAQKQPLRALVRNIGPSIAAIAFSPGALVGQQSILDSFQLPAGESEVFVLDQGDTLYAAGVGAGGTVSIHTSPALPIKFGES